MRDHFACQAARTASLTALLCLSAASTMPAQNHYWVDLTAGSNFHDGSANSPWQTVDFALNGIHAPLPHDSVIHIVGQNPGVEHSTATGEAFPWVLYNNVSLVAQNAAGRSVVVDFSGGPALEFYSTSASMTAQISDIRFECTDGPVVRVAPASGIIHAPTFLDCEFVSQSGAGIRVEGGSLGIVAPTFQDCSIIAGGSAISIGYGSGSYGGTVVERCSLDGQTGVWLSGLATNGVTTISDNDILSDRNGIAIHGDAVVSITNNLVQKRGSRGYAGLELGSNLYWSTSILSGNSVTGFTEGFDLYQVDGVLIKGASVSNCTYGIRARGGTDDLTIRGSLVEQGSYGLYSANQSCAGLRVENNLFRDLTSDGALLTGTWGSDKQIIRNEFERCARGILQWDTNNLVIQGNLFLETTGSAVDVNGSSKAVIVGNEVLRCHQGIQVDDANSLVLSSNLIAECMANGVDLLGPASPSSPPTVEGNTIVNCTGFGLTTALASTVPAYVGNTIFWGNNGAGNEFSGLSSNQYCSCVIEHGGSPGCGNSGTNPGLTANYRLQSNSWCREAGDPAWSNSWVDVDGEPRHTDADWNGLANPDIGADEASESSLTLAGPYNVGTSCIANVQTIASARVEIYVAADRRTSPIISAAGIVVPAFGNFLLEPSKLQGGVPFQSTTADPSGFASFQLPIPSSPALVGWQIAVQAIAKDSATSAGQLTAARAFEVQV